MKLIVVLCLFAGSACWAGDPASALAKQAREAENSGQIVRAYLLYAAAAARDPQNSSYRANRDALEPSAKLLTKAEVQNADISSDIKAAESQSGSTEEPPVELAHLGEWQRDIQLQPIPSLQPSSSLASFDTQGDIRSLFNQVTSVYGVHAIFDPQLQNQQGIRFNVDSADFHTAMEALTAATHTFIFAASPHDIFVAIDSEAKRNEYEPLILLTFPLPNVLDQKDLIEAANAAREVLSLRSIGWDSENRLVMIRDRVSRARLAFSVLQDLLVPRAQVSFELQFVTLDSDRSYHWGASLQTAIQLLDFGHIGGFKSVLSSVGTLSNYFTFGGGASIFGIGLADASLFAKYSNSYSSVLYDATVVVADGQTANFHIGDKYPIPQTLYTGASTNGSSPLYNPAAQITLEDLGLILKLTPRVSGDGDVSMDVEATAKSLGSQTINTVPTINQREFKGTITLHEGEWAVITGMEAETQNRTKSGLIGLANIPGLNQVLSEHTNEIQNSNTLVLIKPTITRMPASLAISPQYFLGPLNGERVVL